ncbi:2'-hydroxyisoflavone reductase [Stackebrandtia albiflava]|uniref:2'-hydroxyisoflavone reductase n=1 Tax=Stackebrandtia albiflava TaxID=406432 RepID=A0A562VC81_9ACTN|nr:NAD-dependent epimerase/dehydratase family protein [Stackebrandtia albiflava]TWJ15495.1 2'-hydroxyisoflavone reductase [Stackebrandtia albiflava]
MRILILGGTSFVGRAIGEAALRHGAHLTLFTRGRTGTDLFPEATRLTGDRDTDDYRSLREGEWDAVVDVSGYVPRHVAGAVEALGDRVGRHVFISSHAVYRREGVEGESDESTPLRPERRDTEELTEDTYGPLKVACESDLRAAYGDRSSVVRCGRVAGPHDNQDAFTYWVRRASLGGRVALPGVPEQPVQVVDSRDVAELVLRLIETGRGGAFNASGPAEPTTLGGLIHTCAEAAGTEVEVVPVPVEAAPFLFPLVRRESMWSTQRRSSARARAAGMPATPLAVTAADVLAWDRERGLPPLAHGFTAEQEAALLAAHA